MTPHEKEIDNMVDGLQKKKRSAIDRSEYKKMNDKIRYLSKLKKIIANQERKRVLSSF